MEQTKGCIIAPPLGLSEPLVTPRLEHAGFCPGTPRKRLDDWGLLKFTAEQGIRPDIDVELMQSPSHDASVASIRYGDSVAAITEQSSLMQMPAELLSGVRILAITAPAPHMTFIMHPRLAPQLRERIVALIERYANDSIQGRRFFAGAGVRKVSDAEMARLDATLPKTEQILKRQ